MSEEVPEDIPEVGEPQAPRLESSDVQSGHSEQNVVEEIPGELNGEQAQVVEESINVSDDDRVSGEGEEVPEKSATARDQSHDQGTDNLSAPHGRDRETAEPKQPLTLTQVNGQDDTPLSHPTNAGEMFPSEAGIREAELSLMSLDTMDLERRQKPKRSPNKKRPLALHRDYKLLRMRAVWCEGIPRQFHPEIVRPSTPPNIVTIRKGRPLNGYMTTGPITAYPRVLEPVPSLEGNEIGKHYNKVRAQQRKEIGYIGSTMGRGLVPLAKNLGYRPATAQKGPGGDLLKTLSQEDVKRAKTPRSTSASDNPLTASTNRKAFGPHELAYVFAADCASSEHDWWLSPSLLLSFDPKLFLHMPQHYMFYGQWEKVVSMLCSLHFLSQKLRLWGVQTVLQDLSDACDGLGEELTKFKDLMSWQEIYATWSAQMRDYDTFFRQNSDAIQEDASSIFQLALDEDYGTCTADAENAKERLTSCAEQLGEADLDGPEDITTFSRLVAHVKVSRAHGVDRCLDDPEMLDEAEANATEKLRQWRDAASPVDAESTVSQLLVSGFKGAHDAVRERGVPKGEPAWYASALAYRRVADDFGHAVNFLTLVDDVADSEAAKEDDAAADDEDRGAAPPTEEAKEHAREGEEGRAPMEPDEAQQAEPNAAEEAPEPTQTSAAPQSHQSQTLESADATSAPAVEVVDGLAIAPAPAVSSTEPASSDAVEATEAAAEASPSAEDAKNDAALASEAGVAAAEPAVAHSRDAEKPPGLGSNASGGGAQAKPSSQFACGGPARQGGGEPTATSGAGSASLAVYISSMLGMREEREVLSRVVLPALRKASWGYGVELSWVDAHDASWGAPAGNALLQALTTMDSCRTAAGERCALFLLAEPKLISNTHTASQQRRRQPEVDAGKEATKQLKGKLQSLFDSVFDAWAFFDINGDWNLTSTEFVLMCKHLAIDEETALRVTRVLDKDGYGVVDPWEFVHPVAWHNLPDYGSAAGISLELYHSQRRRPAIVEDLKLKMRKKAVPVPHIELFFGNRPAPNMIHPEKSGSSQASGRAPALNSRKPALQVPRILPQDPSLPQSMLEETARRLRVAWSPEDTVKDMTLQHAEILHALAAEQQEAEERALEEADAAHSDAGADAAERVPSDEFACVESKETDLSNDDFQPRGNRAREEDGDQLPPAGGALMFLSRLRKEEAEGEEAFACLPHALAEQARRTGYCATYFAGPDRNRLGGFALQAYSMVHQQVLKCVAAQTPPAEDRAVEEESINGEHPKEPEETTGTSVNLKDGPEGEETAVPAREQAKVQRETAAREGDRAAEEGSAATQAEDGVAGEGSGGEGGGAKPGGVSQQDLLREEDERQEALVSLLVAEYAATLELAERGQALWLEGEDAEEHLEAQDRCSSWEEHLAQLSRWAAAQPPTEEAGSEHARVEVAVLLAREGGGVSTFCAELLQRVAAAQQETAEPSDGGKEAAEGGNEAPPGKEQEDKSPPPMRIVRYFKRGLSNGLAVDRYVLAELLGDTMRKSDEEQATPGTLHGALAQVSQLAEEDVLIVVDGLDADEVMKFIEGWHRVSRARGAGLKAEKSAESRPREPQREQEDASEQNAAARSGGGAKGASTKGACSVKVIVSLSIEEGRDIAGTAMMAALQQLAGSGNPRITRVLPEISEGQRLGLLRRQLGELGAELSLERALGLCRQEEGGFPAYLCAVARYLRAMADFVDVNDAALAVEPTLPGVHECCVVPMLEQVHGEAAVRKAVEALLQAPEGLPAGLLRLLITDEMGAVIAAAPFTALLGSLHTVFADRPAPPGWGLARAGAGWPQVAVRLSSRRVQRVLARRYRFRHHVVSQPSLQPAIGAAQPQPRTTPAPSTPYTPQPPAGKARAAAASSRGSRRPGPSPRVQRAASGLSHRSVSSGAGASPGAGRGAAYRAADWEAIKGAMQGVAVERLREEAAAQAQAERTFQGAAAELRQQLQNREFVRSETPEPEECSIQMPRDSPSWSPDAGLHSASTDRLRSADGPRNPAFFLSSSAQPSVSSPLGRTREVYSPGHLRHQSSMRQRLLAHPQLSSSFVEGAEPPTLLELQRTALDLHDVQDHEELISGVTEGASLDRKHMFEALQASALFPALQAELEELTADPEEAVRCKEQVDALRERTQELRHLFAKAAMDVLWRVKALNLFDVSAHLDGVRPGVYMAMWHLKLEPEMDFPDIVCTLQVSPPHSAGPLVSHVISSADQDGCKTGQWSCFVTCSRFFVAAECGVTSRLVCKGTWMTGLVIDAFSLIPVAEDERAALRLELPPVRRTGARAGTAHSQAAQWVVPEGDEARDDGDTAGRPQGEDAADEDEEEQGPAPQDEEGERAGDDPGGIRPESTKPESDPAVQEVPDL